MRESFTYGTVGRAPGNRCLYPEPDRENVAAFPKAVSAAGELDVILASIN
jgi:hypothetical protein